MQTARMAIVLLTIFLTALTAVAMEMMPVATPPAVNHADTSMHGGHGAAQPGDGDHNHGPNDCSYCQTAKATDLLRWPGAVMVHRRLLPGTHNMRTVSYHPQGSTPSRWPRAPPGPGIA